MRKFFAFTCFGLFPVWAAIAIVYLGGKRDHVEADYWAVAPWLILLAVPASGLTLFLTARTIGVYESTTGTLSAKFAASSLALAKSVAVIALIGIALVLYRGSRNRSEHREEMQALAFVTANKSVLAAAGSSPKVSLYSKRGTQFYFSVSGERHIYAIVSATHTLTGTAISLKCITPLSPFEQDTSKSPCDGAIAQPK